MVVNSTFTLVNCAQTSACYCKFRGLIGANHKHFLHFLAVLPEIASQEEIRRQQGRLYLRLARHGQTNAHKFHLQRRSRRPFKFSMEKSIFNSKLHGPAWGRAARDEVKDAGANNFKWWASWGKFRHYHFIHVCVFFHLMTLFPPRRTRRNRENAATGRKWQSLAICIVSSNGVDGANVRLFSARPSKRSLVLDNFRHQRAQQWECLNKMAVLS